MPRIRKLLAATDLVPFALTAAFGADALAGHSKRSVCYLLVDDQGSNFDPNRVLRLNVRKNSRLTTFEELRELGHAKQTTYK